MLDHYKTLGVQRGATRDEIRRAFRGMTKKYHPDRNATRTEWATEQMKRVLEANRVLSNADKRAVYDRSYGAFFEREEKRSNLRPKGRPEGNDPRSSARRILYDLLAGNVSQAVREYETMGDGNGFDLGDHLEPRDWVDCKFLLAEEYAKRENFEKAVKMYEELYHSEHGRLRYSHFLHEVRDRILQICCHGIPKTEEPDVTAQFLLRALGLDLPKNRQAFLHKKIAECHLAVGDIDAARHHLETAFKLQPDLKGVSKIVKQLRMER